LFDYFSASSDEAAADAINLLGGPGVSQAAALSRLSVADIPAAGGMKDAPFDTVPAKGIDPPVQMGTLEALLTGRGYDEIVAGPRAGQVLASQNGGERTVVCLTDELQAGLADADGEKLAFVALPWSRSEEFFGQGDLDILTALLHELAELARRARSKDEHMYCWVCV